jgi:peroxiredoxin
LSEHEKLFAQRRAAIVPVCVDDAQQSQALVKKLNLAFPIAVDTSREVTKAYGVYDAGNDIAWPAIFIVDAAGKVTWRSLAENYKERPSWQVVLDHLPD